MSTLPDQQTEVHVQLGNGAPAFLPTAIGQHYIDIANRRVYQSVGINSVEDWALPLATLKDIRELDLVSDKADVGLGNVENYGVASQSEAELGQANDRYMTPLRVTQLLNSLFMPVLDTFMARTDNPHQVTAAQVGALTAVQTEALLAEKLNSGDLAGLLQVFWSEKVGGAPETLDTIDEIAAALQNNPEVIEALQALVEGNRLTIVEAMDAIAALQALVGESTAFLTAESDLGVNPVALTGDEGAARDLKTILEGMVAKDAAQDQALTDARESLQTQIGTKADKVTTEAALSGLQTAVEGLGTQISDNEQASTDAIQAAQDAVVAAQAVATDMISSVDNLVDQAEAARDAAIATKAVHTFTQTFTLLPAASQVLPIKTTTAPLVLYKIATLITQAGLSNVDVELKVGTNLIYRAEGLAKSVDSTFSLFTEHLGALTLTVTNNGAVACDVKSTLYWCDL